MRNKNDWLKANIILQNNYPSTKNKFLKMIGSISLERIFWLCFHKIASFGTLQQIFFNPKSDTFI